MAAPHKVILKDLLDRFEVEMGRLEAALERLEGLSPPTASPPTDPAAIEAADRYVRNRTLELRGVDSVE